MSALLILMQVAGQIALTRLTPAQAKQWPALAHTALMGVLLGVVVVPTVNNLWSERRDAKNEQRARQREVERQQRAVRDSHLERLRPLLLADSKKLEQLSRQMAVEAAAIGGFRLKDKEQELDRDYWYPDLLYRDFAAHFPDYGKVRERVREEVFAQQKTVFDLQGLALESFKTEAEDEGASIAITLVRECLGTGRGMNLEITTTGYRYTDSGAPDQREAPPPPNLVRRVQAYKAFTPSEAFKSSCDIARERYKRLATELMTLSMEAAVAAESAALSGECSYVRLP
jgi:Tfp pilus assembly protein PilO